MLKQRLNALILPLTTRSRRAKTAVLLLGFAGIGHGASAQFSFTEITGQPFPGMGGSTIAFADVDGNGTQDVLIGGNTSTIEVTKVYRNNGTGNYTEIAGNSFTGISTGDAAFADVDNDGDKDVLITGGSGTTIAKLYLNNGTGVFTLATGTPFVGAGNSSAVAFADIDNDGDQDVMIAGEMPGALQVATKLYTNNGSGVFTEVAGTPFPGMGFCSIAFSDIDNDGDQDVLLAGSLNTGGTSLVTKLYQNNGAGSFTEVMGTPFSGVSSTNSGSFIAIADVDGNGTKDVVISGFTTTSAITKVYRNNGGNNFTEITGNSFALGGTVAVADMDGNGTQDLLIGSYTTGPVSPATRLYSNNGTGVFTQVTGMPFSGIGMGDFALADVDGNGKKDVLFTGYNATYQLVAKLYRNVSIPPCVKDSVVITNTICAAQLPYTWRGKTITTGGVDVAKDTLLNTRGCDSVLHLTLVVKQPTTGTDNRSYCRAALPAVWNGITIPATATSNPAFATYTTTGANGCDSVTTLNLVVKQPVASTDNKTYCRNALPTTWNGITIPATAISNPTFATYTTTGANGCDSVVTLNLVVKQPVATTDIRTYCSSALPAVWNGITIPATATSNPAYTTYTTTGANGCDSVVTLNLTVTNALVPAVGIVANPGNVICAGSSVTFTAVDTNGGTAPAFQWFRNGTVAGSGNSFTSGTLANNDVIFCIMTSSLACVAPRATDTSNIVIMTVNSAPTPVITISASPGVNISSGTTVTFTASVVNGGGTPTYQWKKNNVNVGTNSATYTTNVLANNDTVLCTVTSGNPCAVQQTVNSNMLIMKVSTGIGQVTGSANDLVLYPNPNNGTFTVKGTIKADEAVIEVLNVVGQTVYQESVAIRNDRLDTQVTLPSAIAAGSTYLLRVRTMNRVDVYRFVLAK